MRSKTATAPLGLPLLLVAGLTLLGAACRPNGPQPAARADLGSGTLTRVATPSTSDTIDAQPAEAYVVAVVNSDGTPVVGTTVMFGAENAEVAAPDGTFGSSVSRTTDSRGEVAILLRFGPLAGRGSIEARVPTLRVTDTLALEIAAGETVGPGLVPNDTTVTLGVPFHASASLVDRRGNATGTTLPVNVDFGAFEQGAYGFVAHRIGEGRLSTTNGERTMRTNIRIVPGGEIVYTSRGGAWLSTLDGGRRERLDFTVPSVREPSVSWDPEGNRIVLGGNAGFLVYDLVSRTPSPSTWPGGLAGSNVLWPRFGPNGAIYYSSSDGGGGWDIRRMDPDGADPAIVIPSGQFPNNDFFPDWSPDGSRFVFTADWERRNQFRLRIANPGLTAVTTILLDGVTPVWSPDGTLIAYQESGAIGVVDPDGGARRAWTGGWAKGVTWSPGSNMLVGVIGGQITIVDVRTGEVMGLPHLGDGIAAVAWRPEPDRR